MRLASLFVLLVVMSSGSVWLLFLYANAESLLRPGDSKIIELGQEIYTENCASCHGENLEGQPNWRSPGPDGLLPAPPHDQIGHTWHHTDIVLFELTKFGVAKMAGLENHKTNMPMYDGVLSDDQIIAVLSYIKSTWPDDLRARHDQLNAAARKQ